MPPVAALGASLATAATAAVGSMTLTGLTTGLAIASTGAQLVGMATGSKTLQKIGNYGAMASGVGFAANAVKGMSAGSKVLSDTTMLPKSISGTSSKADAAGFKTMSGLKQADSADSFTSSASNLGYSPNTKTLADKMGGFDPTEEASFWAKSNGILTQYNPMMNILGGMGEAYMMNEAMDQRMKMHNDTFGLNKAQFDRLNVNNGTVVNSSPAVSLSRDNQAYTGILGR